MAIQTLKIIKNWFRTGLKPTQAQFWDTWDSFRHKNEKVPVEDVEGIEELLDSKTDESDFKTINGESILGSGDISIDGGGSQDLQQVLNKGNNYSTYGQNDYMRLTNQYAPGWQFNEMRLMPGGIRVEKSHGGNTSGIVYGNTNVSSLYTRSDYANQTGFRLDTEGLLLKTNVSENGTGIIKSDNLSKLTDYQLPVETTESSITLVSKVNGIPADINGNVVLAADDVIPVSATESGIVNNTPLQELGGVDKLINGVRIGKGAGTTTDNLVVGDIDSMSLNTTGIYNTAIGSGSLHSNTTGESNTGIGANALWANTTSNNNIAIGESSLQNLISGSGHNVAVGTCSLSTLVSGNSNTGIGDFALWKASTGTFNTAVGGLSLQKVTTTSGNTAIGAAAGQNITGTFNVAVGYLSNGETGTTSTGNYNITMGYQSGRALTSGSNNILIENITNASVTSGSNNIIIDSKQKSGVTTGSNNTLIGGWDGAFPPTTSDTVALGTGTGVTRFLSASTGLTTIPTQTNALISADATGKAIITKSYSDNMGAVVNAATSALSGTALNSAYPSAIAGFRVHCLSISGGAIVYEKTTGGWIQYSTTAVTP